jgi:hypothetical protein
VRAANSMEGATHEARACGGVRACGRAGVRACGRAGVRACGRAGAHAPFDLPPTYCLASIRIYDQASGVYVYWT